jgi:hypothetical protein
MPILPAVLAVSPPILACLQTIVDAIEAIVSIRSPVRQLARTLADARSITDPRPIAAQTGKATSRTFTDRGTGADPWPLADARAFPGAGQRRTGGQLAGTLS